MKMNRIYHQSPMEIEKSQPKGKRIVPKTRFTDVGISPTPMIENLLPITAKSVDFIRIFLLFLLSSIIIV